MKHLVLVGYMGCGKTTIGREVARQLSLPFVDAEIGIVRTVSCTDRALLWSSGKETNRIEPPMQSRRHLPDRAEHV